MTSYTTQTFKAAFDAATASAFALSPKNVLLCAVRTTKGEEILISAAKGTGIKAGDRLTGLTIIHGANAQGEERFYATDKANSIFADADFAAL